MGNTDAWVRQANIDHLRRKLAEADSAEQRALLERLLAAEERGASGTDAPSPIKPGPGAA